MSPLSPAVLFSRLLARGRLRHLQLLPAIVDHGSLKRAAEQVGLSQPAATQALTELEQLLQAPLFERHARGMRTTPSGQVVVPVVRNMLQALRASTEVLSALQQGAQAVVRLGSIPAASAALLSQALPAFCRQHPGIRIELSENRGEHLLQELASGGLDLALVRQPLRLPERMTYTALAADRPVVLTGARHPLLQCRPLRLEDLAQATWMQATVGMRVREAFDALMQQAGAVPRLHPISTTSQALLIDILQDQQTVALVPWSLAKPLCHWGLVQALELPGPATFDGLGVLRLPDTEASVVGTLVEALQKASAAPG